MSTSLLYHGFGIRGYKYKNTKYKGGSVNFIFVLSRKGTPCAVHVAGQRK